MAGRDNNEIPVDPSRQRTTALGPRHESHGSGRNGYDYGARNEDSAFPQLNSFSLLSENSRLSYIELHNKVFEDYCTNTVLGNEDISDSQTYWNLTPEQAAISYLDSPDISFDGDPLIVDAAPGLAGKESYAIDFPYGPSVRVPDLFTIASLEPSEDTGLADLFEGEENDGLFIAENETEDGVPIMAGSYPRVAVAKILFSGVASRLNPSNSSNFANNRASVSNRQLGVSRATRHRRRPGD